MSGSDADRPIYVQLVNASHSAEKAVLTAAKRRITELETELRATRRAIELVREVAPPKGGSKRSR